MLYLNTCGSGWFSKISGSIGPSGSEKSVNWDEVTTTVKSSFCFKIVRENVCSPYHKEEALLEINGLEFLFRSICKKIL